MSDEPASSGKGGAENPLASEYSVGYRRPPAQHRFAKGKSGNPKGRPKGSAKATSKGLTLDAGSQRGNALLLEEAYRPVIVREGDRAVEMSTLQAVYRAMGVSAIKGNRFVQRTLAELVQQVENANRQLHVEQIQTFMQWKERGERQLEDARQRGLPEPELVPHPDDIIIDMAKPDVRICGPTTKEDKVEWDKLLENRAVMQTIVSDTAERHKRTRSVQRRDELIDLWHKVQAKFDEIKDNLPKRYRVILKDRSYAEGSSRAGSQKKAEWLGG